MRELSSPLSFFYKFVFIFLWFVGFGFGARGVLFNAPYFDSRWFQYAVLWLGVTAFVFFTTGTIKKVAIDGKFLVVSNFLRTEKIALGKIRSVDGSSFLSPKLVWISFNEKSAFGDRVTFLPKHRMQSGGLGKHPLVKELTDELKL